MFMFVKNTFESGYPIAKPFVIFSGQVKKLFLTPICVLVFVQYLF